MITIQTSKSSEEIEKILTEYIGPRVYWLHSYRFGGTNWHVKAEKFVDYVTVKIDAEDEKLATFIQLKL